MESTHDTARREIEQWRGQCLNLFARAELAVSMTLQSANESGKAVKLRHFAAQRLEDLIKAVQNLGGTKKQKIAFQEALEAWQSVEAQRQFLAHGVAKESLDREGKWVVMFDLTSFRKNAAEPLRWTITQDKAEAFVEELHKRFTRLSGELGHVRTRLAS